MSFFRPQKSDIQLSAKWYEKQQQGPGKRFKQQISGSIEGIINPQIGYGTVYMSLSRVFVEVFPYVIYFKNDLPRKRIVIYAVIHEKQNREDILIKRM